jgi:hypothetical protein
MPPQDDVLDDQIRAALLRTFVADADGASALPDVQAKAQSRRNRHRAAGALGSILAVGLLAVSLANTAGHETVRTDSPSPPTSSPSAPTNYGFAPLTPLLDEPLPVAPRTELLVSDGHVLSVESTPESLILSLTDAAGGAGSMSADPEAIPALVSGGQGPASNDPVPKHYLYGITRAEVARIDWVRDSGTVSVQTIEHDAFPQLRFFLIEDTEPTASHEPRPEVPYLVAYGADGALLTDSERIDAEQQAFLQEVDRRKGVEEKVAGVRDVRVSDDDQSLTLAVFNCGEDPFPAWTIDESAVRISVTVKRPYNEGDCLDGETMEAGIGLNERLAGRTIIDARTGEPIPLRTEP